MSKHVVVSIQTPYWEWVKSEAALIGTDGCSAVMGFHIECCFEHDISYYYARDPRDAYRQWRQGVTDYWGPADPITFADTNVRFRQCLQNRSKFGRWSFMAFYRWLGVKYGSQPAWDKHRERERKEQEEVLGV